MSWRERMGPATFRGVPFYVDTSERTGGRRGVTHEYPLRDVPFREDLGRESRGFAVEGYVVGDDYLDKRDALLAALEEAGPGVLVHPYYGTKTVAVVGGFRVRESTQAGGMASVSVTFEETEETPSQPTAAPDTAGVLATRATTARDVTGAQFTSEYAPGIHTASLAEMVVALADTVTASGAEVTRALEELASTAATLVTDGEELFTALSDLFDLLTGGLMDVYAFDPGQRPPATTPSREVEQQNFDFLQRAIQTLAVIRAAGLAGEDTFESYDAAVTTRDAITDALDEQMDLAADDVYQTLSDLRAAVVAAVPGQDSDLPRLTPYTPVESLPSLVLSWELYGNVTGEADIVARNGVRHPGFLVGGRTLEVLSEA